MKEIPLSLGYVALVDDEDYEVVSRLRWWANIVRRKDGTILNVYAQAHCVRGGKKTCIRMHQLILGGRRGDHKNRNGLDNRRSNLRLAEQYQNLWNRRTYRNNSSGVKGVCFNNGCWSARISVNGKRFVLGYFHSKEEAGEAYQRAAVRLHGDFA